MQNKDSKPQQPLRNGQPQEADSKEEEPRATPPWGLVPAVFPKPASPQIPGAQPLHLPPIPSAQQTQQLQAVPKPVSHPEGSPTMKNAASLLSLAPGLKIAARTDLKGRVLDAAGVGDAESLCAVAAMCHTTLSQSEDLLGLGALHSWNLNTPDVSIFVQRTNTQLLVVSGEPTKNPEGVLRRLVLSLAEVNL